MSIAEIKSMVAFIPEFLPNRCLQFGFTDVTGKTHKVVVGEDVQRIGLKGWERPINVSPRDPIWQALFLAPLVKEGRQQYKVAVTFPYSLKSEFEQYKPSGRLKITLPDYQGGESSRMISISEVLEIPEAYAHATAYRKVLKKDCVVISIGFGTLEMGMVDSSGQIFEPRLASVTYGLHKAAPLFRAELKKLGFDDSEIRVKDQDHIIDAIMCRVVDEAEGLPVSEPVNLIVRGKALTAKDLIESANKALTIYSDNMVPHIKDYVETQRYTSNVEFVITGGGRNMRIVVEKTKGALACYNLNNVTVATKQAAKYSAAVGIAMIAAKFWGEEDLDVIGIDVGNSSVLYESALDQVDEDVLKMKSLQPLELQSPDNASYTIQ